MGRARWLRLVATAGPRVRRGVLGLMSVCAAVACVQSATSPGVRPPTAQASGAPDDLVPTSGDASGAVPTGPTLVAADFRPVWQDPALPSVATALAADDAQAAVAALERSLSEGPSAAEPLSDAVRAARMMLLARLQRERDRPAQALRLYEQVTKLDATDEVVADYLAHAHWLAAAILRDSDRPDEAMKHLDALGDDVALPIRMRRAQVLAEAGRLDEAVPLFEAELSSFDSESDRVRLGLPFIQALLKSPSAENNKRAAKWADRLQAESRSSTRRAQAKQLRQEALSRMAHADRQLVESPAPEDRAQRAAWLAEADHHRDALGDAEQALRDLNLSALADEDQRSPAACLATFAQAQALFGLKREAEGLAAYELAASRCIGEDVLATVLYRGGRAAQRGGQHASAARLFAMLEVAEPQHRLSDDARLHRTEALRASGRLEEAGELIVNMAADYPDGDMVGDAYFAIALDHLEAGEAANALVWLDRGLQARPTERDYFRAGRFPYFRARALQVLGRTAEATTAYEQLIRAQPLTYYSSLAVARRGEIGASPTAGTDLVRAELQSPRPFAVKRTDKLDDPTFRRGWALARVGEVELAMAQFQELGVGRGEAEPEIAYAAAIALAGADDIRGSHGILRNSLMPAPDGLPRTAGPVSWLDHYPAGAPREIWEIAYPRPYADIVSAKVAENGISEALAYAIMREESAFSPRVVSSANAYGLMQLIEPTARSMARPLGLASDPESLKKPEINVALGCRFLGWLERRFPDNPLLAIPSYNAGPGNPDKWIAARPEAPFDIWVERIPFRETRRYTKRVLTSYAAYDVLYGRGSGGPFAAPFEASPNAAEKARAEEEAE